MTPAELRSAREALGLTQRGLAERLSVSENTIWRWEHPNGRWRVDRPEMLRLALECLMMHQTRAPAGKQAASLNSKEAR